MERLENSILNKMILAMQTMKELCGELDSVMEEMQFEFLKELQEYRRTGLTPEQVEELAYLRKRYEDESYDYCGEYGTEECQFKGLIEDYSKGTLLQLPCRVGDTVYSDSKYFGVLAYEINSINISCGISFEAIASRNDEMLDAIDLDVEDIGKTVFFTREEAEAKLAEMEGDNE